MTMEVMCKLEEYLDEDCRMTLTDMCDRLRSDMGVVVGKSSAHRALQGMLYSIRKLRIEKATMNMAVNKDKRKTFVKKLNEHIVRRGMIVYRDETNFNLYLLRTEGWSRVSERAVVQLAPSQGQNLHVQAGVSSGTGVVLLRPHAGSTNMEENAWFIPDLFVAALHSAEYRELGASSKIVIVTDNAPAHSRVESLARDNLAADGIISGSNLVVLRLAPYSPMLNPIEGCWSVLKARMRRFMAAKKEFLVRSDCDTYTAHRLALMKEAVEVCWPVLTQRLVWRMERHCLKACFAAERGEDMLLGR